MFPDNFGQHDWQTPRASIHFFASPRREKCSHRKSTMPQPGKTHKGLAKRFKVTASGKVKHRNANRGHLMGKKSGNRKRRLRKDGVRTGFNAVYIVEALRPSS
jgi:large subunit ribosomal protein L35